MKLATPAHKNRIRLSVAPQFHWIASTLLLILCVAGFLAVRLPLAVNWSRLLSLYWIGLSLHSIVFAVLLFLIGFPATQTVGPLWMHFKKQKARAAFFVIFSAIILLKFGLANGFVLIVLATVLTELVDRSQGDLDAILRILKPLLVPAVYLFLGLVMVFAYNDLIAIIRNPSAYDWLYLKLDSYLLFGSSVSAIAHAVIQRFPLSGAFDEYVYYGMFNQIGAALIILALCKGSKEAARYVGTLLTAYYLGLICFFLWPSMGPYFLCPTHFSVFPHSLRTSGAQMGMEQKIQLLATHRQFSQVDTDYFVAFPCLHIAQPVIVAWYLRRWKRILGFLLAYDALLVMAILLLEWHYLVDVIGGFVVAWVAIQLNKGRKARGEARTADSTQIDTVLANAGGQPS